MRAFVDEHDLIRVKVALCRGCHGELCEEILGNYKALERFDEGARLLEDIGMYDEAGEFLASIKG
jgi:coenzyme F420-reducing hydrogenase delta subunit